MEEVTKEIQLVIFDFSGIFERILIQLRLQLTATVIDDLVSIIETEIREIKKDNLNLKKINKNLKEELNKNRRDSSQFFMQQMKETEKEELAKKDNVITELLRKLNFWRKNLIKKLRNKKSKLKSLKNN